MADTQNEIQQQPQNEGSPIGTPKPITLPRTGGLLRAVFDRGVRSGAIQQGPITAATRVKPLATGVTSEAQPKPISLQGAGMGKPPRIKEQPAPKLVGQVEKGKPVQPIAVPEVSDIQALAPQRQLTEKEIEADRTKYLPTAITNTLETARNSAQDKGYFDTFVAPNLKKTLEEDFNSGELSVSLNKDRYPVIVRKTDGVTENIFQGVRDRINAIKGLDEYDRLDDAGKIQFLSGKSTFRVPTLSQVGSPTKDIYSGEPTQEYQGAVPTERGAAGEVAYGAGGVLPDITAGLITAPVNLLVPGYSIASVGAIQGRTGAINAAQQAFQVAKQNGLSDEESLQIAKNAEKRGAVTGVLEGVASQYFGNKIFKAFSKPATKTALTGFFNQTKNFLKNAVTTTGKAALPLAADMGVAGGMEIVRQEGLSDEGLINPNRDKEILENVKMEGLVGFVFAIAGKAVQVPKYLQSYASSVLSTMDPDDMVDYATELELTGQAAPGFANTVRDEVKKYNEAKKAAGDNVSTEVEPTVVGLIMKKKGLQEKLKDADDTIKPQIQSQINEINERIIATIDTKVPQEVDDKTQSKIEQDATKESEQVSTVQEGGTTESTGTLPRQQEVGQGEGSQRQATEQGANIGDSNIGSEAQVTEGQSTAADIKKYSVEEGIPEEDLVSANDVFKNNYQKKIGNIADRKKLIKDNKDNTKEESVSINNIIPTQAALEKENIINLRDKDSVLPTLIKDGDNYFVVDGHHRIASQINNGDTQIMANVINLKPSDETQGKTKKAGDAIRAFKIKQAPNTLDTNIFGIPIAMYNTVLDVAANAADLGADVVEAVRKYLAEQNPEDIAGIDENALIEDVKSKLPKQEAKPTITQDDVINYESSSEKRIQEEKKAKRTVNQTYWRKVLRWFDENQVNVIKELRKTGRFSDLLVSALEAIRHTSTDSNQRISDFNKSVYDGLSDKNNIQIGSASFSEKGLLESVIKAKRLIEIQRMLGDKFNRFQSLDAEYNAALDAYAAINEATEKNKKKLDKVAEKINELNKQIVSANLDENNQEEFDKLVDAVRIQHDKADAILSEIESFSEDTKQAVARVRESRNKRQDALEYIANRGVLIRNDDGSYSLGNYKMGEIKEGVPYTSKEAQAFIDAASSSDRFSDIDARSEAAFDNFKKILDEQYEAGLIPQAVYDDLSQYKYVPIKYISSVLTEGNSAFMKSRGGAGIKALTGGSDGAQITDYSTLFNIYTTTALKNIATNKALQMLEKAIKSDLPQMKATNMYNQNIVVELAETEKKKDGTDKVDKFGNKVYKKPKEGYTNIKVHNKDGITMLTAPTWFADEFYGHSEYNRGLSMASSLLGVNLLRKMVTIANPAFGIAQLATLDPIQAILTAKGFSPILPVAYAEIAAEWPAAFVNISKKKAIYNEAVKNGVFGDIAARSGIDKFYDNTIFTGIKDIDDKVSRMNLFDKFQMATDISKVPGIKQAIEFGESMVGGSEKMTRLIVYKKAKQYFIDQGYSAEEAGQLAASEARNTANFSRAGDIIKQANHVIPYLSAAYATKRAVVKSFKNNPAKATAIVGQMALGGLVVTLWSIGKMSDDEREREYWGEMYKALPDYYKKNYIVIRNFTHKIGDDITNAFIRVPLPFGAKQMYTGIVSASMGEYMDEPSTTKEAIVSSILSTLDMAGLEDVSLPPTASALVKYQLNIDPYTGYKIVYDESTGEFAYTEEKEGTLPMIQGAAEKTKAFSAPRLQAAIESFTGKFERNPFTQITVNALNSLYELAARQDNSIIKSIKDDPNKLIEGPLTSISGRFTATPTKYYKNKLNSMIVDYIYTKINNNFNKALIDVADKRKQKIGVADMTSNEQMAFFTKDAEKFIKDVERDLGKKEALKYEKMLRDARLGEIKDVLKLKIIEDDSLKKLATEKNPAILGRAAYDILKDASDNPNKKILIATALQVTEFFRDTKVVGSYMERMLEDSFGTEYRDKFKNTLKGSRSQAIEKMYRASKEFNSDSNEVKEEKLGMIEVMNFYIDSKNYDRLTTKGDTITERLFGFDYPRKQK